MLHQDTFPKDEIITWSGTLGTTLDYGWLLSEVSGSYGRITLFPDKVSSPSMIKHAMQHTMQSTHFLNPGHTGGLVLIKLCLNT